MRSSGVRLSGAEHHHLMHVGEGRALSGDPAAEIGGEAGARPAARREPGRGDVGRADAAEREAGQGPRQLHLAEPAARRVAFPAMAQHVDEIAAALPGGRASGRGRRQAVGQEQQVPPHHSQADIVGEIELGPAVRHLHRPQLHQIGVDRIGIRPRHAAIGGIGHRGIERLAVAPRAVMQRLPEIIGAPAADAVVGIGRDIGGVDHPEAALHRQAAGKRRAARRGVAGGAVRRFGEIFPARHHLGRRTRHSALGRRSCRSAASPRPRRPAPRRQDHRDDEGHRARRRKLMRRPASGRGSPGSHRAPPGSSGHSRCSGRYGFPAPRRPSSRPRRAAPARASAARSARWRH